MISLSIHFKLACGIRKKMKNFICDYPLCILEMEVGPYFLIYNVVLAYFDSSWFLKSADDLCFEVLKYAHGTPT